MKSKLMDLARIAARALVTIPKRIRYRAGPRAGDMVAFEIEGDRVVVRNVGPARDNDLRHASGNMSEWASPEDEAAWRDL